MVAFVVLLKVGFFKLFTGKVPAVHLADSSTVFMYCFLMFGLCNKVQRKYSRKKTHSFIHYHPKLKYVFNADLFSEGKRSDNFIGILYRYSVSVFCISCELRIFVTEAKDEFMRN